MVTCPTMVVLDRPFPSELMTRAIREFELVSFPVTPDATGFAAQHGLKVVSLRGFAACLERDRGFLVCTSPDGPRWTIENLPGSRPARQARLLSDKYAFRQATRTIWPEFGFTRVPREAVGRVPLPPELLPGVVKPLSGFGGQGVRRVRDNREWADLVALSAGDVDADTLLVEQEIPGDEYAADVYFDGDGRAVALTVLWRTPDRGPALKPVVYLVTPELARRLAPVIEATLTTVGRKLGLSNLVAVAELRIAGPDVGVIEINPLRFDAWCTVDIARHAYGLDPYRCLVTGSRPDWSRDPHPGEDHFVVFVPSAGEPDGMADLPAGCRLIDLRTADTARWGYSAAAFVRGPSMARADVLTWLGKGFVHPLQRF